MDYIIGLPWEAFSPRFPQRRKERKDKLGFKKENNLGEIFL
jgi:hypothetical protein